MDVGLGILEILGSIIKNLDMFVVVLSYWDKYYFYFKEVIFRILLVYSF